MTSVFRGPGLARMQAAARQFVGTPAPTPVAVGLAGRGVCTSSHVQPQHSSRRSGTAPRSAAAPSPPASEPEASTSGTTPGTIYSRPDLYDVAFSYRDFKSEVKFLLDAYKKHAGGQPSSVLELGCGPARHLAGLAKAGVPQVVGLDLSPEMLAHAAGVVARNGGPKAASVQLLQGSMAEFDLPNKSFDMVMCLLGTLSHLLDTQEVINCFRCAAAHLRPGGLLLLELAHPGDLFDGTLIIGESGKEVWEVPYKEDRKVFVEWGAEFDNFDPVTQIIYRTVTINVLNGDEVSESVEEVVPYRQFTVRELELLAGMAGLEVCSLYGEMRLGVDLEHEDAYRMVAVYRKK